MIFEWKFEWAELRNQYNVLGWKGTLMIYLWNKDRYIWTGPNEFDVEFFGTEATVQKELERNMSPCYSVDGQFWFKHSFELEPIYEKKTVLIVEGRRIKINKKILSKNSKYFAELLNNEKSEFPIENVGYDDMKQLLGIFQAESRVRCAKSFRKVLELADHFQLLPSVRLFLEFHLLICNEHSLKEKIELADTFKMDQLLEQSLNQLDSSSDIPRLVGTSQLSEGVKSKLFDKMVSFSK